MKRWYAVQAKPQEDARAETHLRNQGYDVFRPLLRRRIRRAGRMVSRTESLFPRYLFIRLDDEHENWAPIRSTRGVAGLVKFGQSPAPVPEEIIHDINCRIDPDTGCVDIGKSTDYRPNEAVTITEGPFAGHSGLFQARSGEERVIVLLNIMNQQKPVKLPESAISR